MSHVPRICVNFCKLCSFLKKKKKREQKPNQVWFYFQSSRKSALLTAAKKDRLKKNPSRVRFAEEIIVNGASVPSVSLFALDSWEYWRYMDNEYREWLRCRMNLLICMLIDKWLLTVEIASLSKVKKWSFCLHNDIS